MGETKMDHETYDRLTVLMKRALVGLLIGLIPAGLVFFTCWRSFWVFAIPAGMAVLAMALADWFPPFIKGFLRLLQELWPW